MSQRNAKPLKWHGKGVSDTLDGSTSFTGAMSALTNLVPDPSSANLWQCRPAAQAILSSLTLPTGTAGFVSVYKIIGDLLYGMVATTNPAGYDMPFAINLLTGLQITVTGTQTATTLPLSQPSTGAWIPPQMDVISTKLLVAHPGFVGTAGNWIGWFDISTPTSPVWNAGNMTGLVTFTTAPTAVAQFNGRAYYIHNAPGAPAVIFSDVLVPLNATNANQVLTLNDNQALTAIGKLPLNNQLGGIIQSLMVFKDDTNIFQITGDPTTSNLFVNSLNVSTGTMAPNSICATPKGLVFMAPDGLRLITYTANVTDPIGIDGKGINIPFVYAVVPSRIAAACNGNVLRISVANGNAAGSPNQEYWYDIARQIWTGPHQFANTTSSSLLQPYRNTFVITPIGVTQSLWTSDVQQSSTSNFAENGVGLRWSWNTPLLPDTDEIVNNCMTEATLDLAVGPVSGTVVISAIDQNGVVINTVSIRIAGGTTIWGQFTWGAAVWGGITPLLAPYQLQWTIPIVFSRMSINAHGVSTGGFKIGALHMLYQRLKTWTNTAAAA